MCLIHDGDNRKSGYFRELVFCAKFDELVASGDVCLKILAYLQLRRTI